MKIAAVGAVCAFMLLSACSKDRLSNTAVDRCPLVRIGDSPHPAGEGVVTKLLSQNEAMALLSRTQAAVGRPIECAYVNNIRAVIMTDDGTVKTILIPYGMTVAIGDHVSFQSAYLSPRPLCSYVPNLAVTKNTPVGDASSNIAPQNDDSGSVTMAAIYQRLDVSTLNPTLIPRRPMPGRYLRDFGFNIVKYSKTGFISTTDTNVFSYQVTLLNQSQDKMIICVNHWTTYIPSNRVQLAQTVTLKNGVYIGTGERPRDGRCGNVHPSPIRVIPRR